MPYRRKGSPYWWVKFTDASGKPTYKSTRTTDLEEAKALEAKWRLEAYQLRQWGIQPEHTFDEMMHAYITAKKDEIRSLDRLVYACQRLQPHFTGKYVERLGRADISSYILARKADGVAASTINRELDVLSAAYGYAGKALEWKVGNPVAGMSLKQPEGRLRWITQEEAKRLITEAGKEVQKSPHLPDFIQLALNTGCRKGELLNLTWDRVDFHTNQIRLEGEHTKNGKRRVVPLNEIACKALQGRIRFRETYCPNSPWVFAHKDGKRLQDITNGFTSACSRAGISNFRIHDLRHTCASWLVSAGVSLYEVKELLGHSSIEMTERYAHLAPDNLGEVAKTLNRLQSSDSEKKLQSVN